MAFYFILGLLAGGIVGFFVYFSVRREITRLDEEKQLLSMEKGIVLEFMHNMVEAIGEGLRREELFDRVVHAAVLSTGALSACIFVKRPDNMMQGVAVEGLFPPHRPLSEAARVKLTTRTRFIEEVLRNEVFAVGDGLVGEVAQIGEGMLIPDAEIDDRIVKHDDPALTVRSVIVVPIAFKSDVIAVLAICNPADGHSFGETDFSLAMSLAEQAGLAIHNSDLMALQIEKSKLESDLSLASNIQGMLLPSRFPKVPHLEIEANYIPAMKVGGDLYDVFALDENRVGVAIADVSGKGIPASLLMAICQSNLRYLARAHDSPAHVLRELNRALGNELAKGMFITMIYAIVDMKEERVSLARAGHELPLLFHCDEETGFCRPQSLGSEGMALGLVPPAIFDITLTETSCGFEAGDVLVLFTDGVTEAVNAEGVEFSTGRLADIVRTLRERPIEELNQGVLDQVARYAGEQGQSDDITLVTLRHNGVTQAAKPTQ